MADKTIGELKRASVPLDRNGKVAFESSQGDAEYFEISDLEDVAVAAAKEQTDAAKREADRAKTEADAAAESARDAADVALHPPILNDGSDHWWTWSTDANDYVESDKDAGVSLTVSPDTVTGDPGSAAKVENIGTATDPVLKFTLPRGDPGEVTQEELDTALAGKQDKLTIDTTPTEGSQNAVQSGGVYDALQKKPNPNLLINTNFANPVNRNGKTEYTTVGYTIDRWRIDYDNTRVTLDTDGISIYCPSTVATFAQVIESSVLQPGQEVTLSFLLSSGELFTNSGIISTDPAFVGSIAATTLPNLGWIDLFGAPGQPYSARLVLAQDDAAVKIKAVKLEFGSQQTLAHQENGVWVLNEIPSYAEEYAKCALYDPKSGEFVGSPTYTNRNLLDNWYFVGGGSQQGGGQFPINQRGQTEYLTSSRMYNIDRWIHYGTGETVSLLEDCIKVTGKGYETFGQRIGNPEKLNGQYITFSVLLRNPSSNVRISIYNESSGSVLISENAMASDAYNIVSCTTKIDGIKSGNRCLCILYPSYATDVSADVYLKAAKLELGSQQTLAHQDENGNWVLNEIPRYDEELRKCQRYYYSSVFENDIYVSPSIGASLYGFLTVNVKFPVPMRVVPTVTIGTLENGVFQAGKMANGYTGDVIDPQAVLHSASKYSIETIRLNDPEALFVDLDPQTDGFSFHYIADANL